MSMRKNYIPTRIILTVLSLVTLFGQSVTALEATGGRLWTFYKNRALVLTESTGIWDTKVLASRIIHMDAGPTGNLWYALKKGLAGHRNGSWHHYNKMNTRSGPFTGDNFQCLAPAGPDTLWAGTSKGGLVCCTDSGWTVFDTTRGLVNMKITTLLRQADGTLWIGTASGLNSFRGGTFTSYPVGDCLLGAYVKSLTEDSRGNLWAECYNYTGLTLEDMKVGMCRYDGRTWSQFRFTHPITHVLPAPSGLVWLVTRNRESGTSTLFTFTKKRWAVVDSSHLGINRLAADSTGQLWVATEGGLFTYDGRAWDRVPQTKGKNADMVFVDSRNHIWCSYSDDNRSMFIGEYHGRTWNTCSLFPEKNIRKITETPEGLWFGTDNGLIGYANGTWRLYDELHPSVSVRIRDMAYQPGRNRLWAATEKGIAHRDSTGTWHPYVNQGLNQKHVYSVSGMPDGTVWVNSYHWHTFDGKSWMPLNERYSYTPAGNPLEFASAGPAGSVWLWSADFPGISVCNRSSITFFPELKEALTAYGSTVTAENVPPGGLWAHDGKKLWAVNRSAGTVSYRKDDGSWHDLAVNPVAAAVLAPGSLAVCDRYGVFTTGGKRLRSLILPDHLRFRDMSAVDGGTLWLEGDRELVRYRAGTCRIYPFPAGKNSGPAEYGWIPAAETCAVQGLCADGSGRMFLATDRGPAYETGGAVTFIRAKNRLPRAAVKEVLSTPGGLWVVHGFGASLLRKNRWKHYDIKKGLISNLLHGITAGPDGTVYFFAPYGISEYKDGTWTNHTAFGGTSYPNVQDVLPLPGGRLVLATLSGILLKENGTWHRIGRAEGLPADSVYSVTMLPGDTLAAATAAGICKVTGKSTISPPAKPRCGPGTRFLARPDGQVRLLATSSAGPGKRLYEYGERGWKERLSRLHKTCAAFSENGTLYLGSPGGVFVIRQP